MSILPTCMALRMKVCIVRDKMGNLRVLLGFRIHYLLIYRCCAFFRVIVILYSLSAIAGVFYRIVSVIKNHVNFLPQYHSP